MTGFASFSDVIAEASAGKRQQLPFSQAGTANTLQRGSTLWTVGPMPAIGETPAAPPGGTVCTRTTVGAIGQVDPGGTDTSHLTTQVAMPSAGPHTLIVYDRLWHCRVSNTAGAQAITGVPTRYTGTDAAGTMMWIEAQTATPATAHTHSITYVDEAGTTGIVVTSAVTAAITAVNTFDQPVGGGGLFIPLASGDLGVRNITSYNIGTTIASGALNLVIGRPLMWIPMLAANVPALIDGINSALSLAEVKTNACLGHIIVPGVTSATTFQGAHDLLAG